ncbi:unnamed protein product, partial [Tuber aestivum]
LTLPRIILSYIKCDWRIILHLCTPTGSIEHWVVSESQGKLKCRDERSSGWGNLWALGAKPRTSRNININVSSRKTMS